jgi:phosphomannomutase
MNKVLYLFDVDGTLTPSRKRMNPDFSDWFRKYFKDKEYCLVSGSDLPQIRHQLGSKIADRAAAIFACSGNVVFSGGKVIKVNKFNPTSELIHELTERIRLSPWLNKTGKHLELRDGLLNFSILGRNCTDEEREEYYKWDLVNKERKKICTELSQMFPELCFEVGGEISIDIYPKGKDKSQVLKYLKGYKILFFGDGIEPGKNDWSLAEALTNDDMYYRVEDWKETKKYLKIVEKQNEELLDL